MMRFFALIGAAVLALFADGATAQQKTPSHVFQRVVEIEERLKLLLAADFSTLQAPQVSATLPHRPRHVYAMLAFFDQKLETLRQLNGLPRQTAIAIPAKRILPDDVFKGLDQVSERVDGLAEVYGADFSEVEVALVPGKTPGDVYARLSRVPAMLEALFVPATVPNDVFENAQRVANEVYIIAAHFGIDQPASVRPASGKRPADVLNAISKLRSELVDLAARDATCMPEGGFAEPTPVSGNVTPAMVNVSMLLTLADLVDMRVTCTTSTAPTLSPPAAAGRTPSDVFAVVESAYATLAAIGEEGL